MCSSLLSILLGALESWPKWTEWTTLLGFWFGWANEKSKEETRGRMERESGQLICWPLAEIRMTLFALCQNCFSSTFSIKVGGTSECLIVPCLGKSGRCFLKTKVDTPSEGYCICCFQICWCHKCGPPQTRCAAWGPMTDSDILSQSENTCEGQNSSGTFFPPYFLLLFLLSLPKTVFSILS